MMKRFFVLVITVFSLNALNAQTDSLYFELGINSMKLLNPGLNPSAKQDPDVWNPYMLNAELNFKRIGLRTSLGLNSKHEKQLPTGANGLTTTTTDTSSTHFRIGLNYSILLTERWSVKLGLDFYSRVDHTEIRNEYRNHEAQDVDAYREWTYSESGLSPSISIQYHLSPRISLGTELLYRMGGYAVDDLDGNNLSENVIEKKYEGAKRNFVVPTALFLSVRF